MVLDRLDNPLNLLFYALGYAAGVSVGIKIEDQLALGYTMVTVILPTNTDEEKNLPKILRQEGYGVTQSYGEGLEGPRLILEILSQRKSEKKLFQKSNKSKNGPLSLAMSPNIFLAAFGRRKSVGEKLGSKNKKGIALFSPVRRSFLRYNRQEFGLEGSEFEWKNKQTA